MKMLNVSASPHVRDKETTQSIMLDVIIAMLPAAAYGTVQFGLHAFLVLVATVAASVLAEYWFEKGTGRPVTVKDLSAVVTGMILALNMPPEIPIWIPVLGAFFAIIVVKQLYGGLGQNFMNPALAARCFLLISCARHMTDFTSAKLGYDAASGPTPLMAVKTAAKAGESVSPDMVMSMFIGRIPGTIGEVSAIALLIGAAYLLIRKVITWRIPVIYIATVAVFSFIFGEQDLNYVLAQILGGGLIFGAFFMATDYVTTPITVKGQVIFAVFIGILTGLFRIFGTSAEGVSYAIILGNIVTPLIERATVPAAFGREAKKK
jgi:electron transport complex protein RnfD